MEEGDSEVLRQSGTVQKVVRHAWNDAQESPERKHDRLQTRNLTAGALSHSLYSNTLQCTTQNYISEDIWLYAGSWGILLEGLLHFWTFWCEKIFLKITTTNAKRKLKIGIASHTKKWKLFAKRPNILAMHSEIILHKNKRKKSQIELKVIEFPLVVKFSTAWQMRDKGGI